MTSAASRTGKPAGKGPARPQDAPSRDYRLPFSEQDVRAACEEAHDKRRPPGVPPPTNLDYPDLVDFESAQSFPASDPPSGY